MKHFYILLLIICTGFAQAQIINFPDANFKAKLLSPESAYLMSEGWVSADANNDGEIEMSEAAAIFALDVSSANISDLTGISNFVNLKTLWCQNNLLTTITIDNSIEMWDVNASHNQLNSIDVNFVTGEQEFDPGIDLSYNNLTTFSLSNCVVWFGLDLSHNQLTSLNINNCNLTSFEVQNNSLGSVNFTGNNSIDSYANFMNNPFNGLYLNNVNFDYEGNLVFGNNIRDALYFGGYQPGMITYSSVNTACDFGNYQRITNCDPYHTGEIYVYNSPNLQNIILKNGFNHTTVTCDEGGDIFDNPALKLSLTNVPNLSHICVDSPAEKTCVQFWVDLANLQNQITIDSNCPISSMNVEESTETKFVVFPIPATNVLQVQSSADLVISGLEIYNNLGQLVQKEIGNQQSIDISGLANGMYHLRIHSDGAVETKRFLKE